MSDEVDIKIGGFLRFSMIDYPGLISSVIFCQGCPNRCVYCHNPTLIPYTTDSSIPYTNIEAFLESRRGLIDAVVFSGGEPLIQTSLQTAIKRIKKMGYKVGIHTTGISEVLMRDVISDIDWVGLDVKAPMRKYAIVAGRDISRETYKCLSLIRSFGTSHEIRTTYDSDVMDENDLQTISKELYEAGEREWVIQRCIRYKSGVRLALSLPSKRVLDMINTRLKVTIR